MSNDRQSNETIEIDIAGAVTGSGQVTIGDENTQVLVERAVESAMSELEGPALEGLAHALGLARAPDPTPRATPVRKSSIRIGGSVQGQNVVIGSGNVQVVVASVAQALQRLPVRERVGLLRRFAPSDELLETAERLQLLPATYESFERNVSPRRPELQPSLWRRKLAALERVVGLVETPSTPRGTCFLVGRDLVLTNYHVVSSYLGREGVPTDLRIRFDFQEQGALGGAGTLHPLAEGAWCVAHSPYSDADQRGVVPEQQDLLDFALLRLARPAGEDATSGAARGWLTLTGAPQPQPGDPLLILQHPRGQSLTLCFGKVLQLQGGDSRLRYDTNTSSGSSGSPCLNDNLELVALHHMGDPDFAPTHVPLYNQGIPSQKLAEHLQQRGIRLTPP